MSVSVEIQVLLRLCFYGVDVDVSIYANLSFQHITLMWRNTNLPNRADLEAHSVYVQNFDLLVERCDRIVSEKQILI